MKNSLFVLLASALMATTSYAQDSEREEQTPKRVPGKNEIGLFGEIFNNSGNTNSNYATYTGLQYKRWAKPNIAYRITGAAGGFNNNSMPRFVDKRGDTLIQSRTYANVPMFFAGGGVEVQRQFFKKVYLYAAIEVLAGYGRSTYDEILSKELQKDITPFTPYPYPTYYESSKIKSGEVSAFALDVTPFIGGKINFKRLCVGTEISIMKPGIQSVKYSDMPAYTTADFSAGNFRQRVYLNFRF